jgi:HEPN domain-containing protein/predicted nucleotidyltransferase
MIQRPSDAGDDVLATVARAVIDELRPARVILFGSRARGEARPDSDYDLVIELAHDALESDAIRTRARQAIAKAAARVAVDVMLRRPGQIEARCDDPGYMDWDIAREGIVVYPAGLDESVVRPGAADRVREGTHPSIADWLARADEDRRDSRNNLAAGRDASWTSVCFHSQQMAEKYLKALLVRCGVRPPRTRDLTELVELARRHGRKLPAIDLACATLQEFAVAARYPEDVGILSEANAQQAWSAAQHVCAAVDRELD